MTDVIISNLITIGVVGAGFIGNALYLRGNFGARIKNNESNISALWDEKQSITTCEAKAGGIDTRVSRLERIRNGGIT